VQEFNPATARGNGFVFQDYKSSHLIQAMERAINAYFSKSLWRRLQMNAMSMDFSSQRTAEGYIRVFQWARQKIGL
jgi:starch synthase